MRASTGPGVVSSRLWLLDESLSSSFPLDTDWDHITSGESLCQPVLAPLSPCPRSSVTLSSLLCQPVLAPLSPCPHSSVTLSSLLCQPVLAPLSACPRSSVSLSSLLCQPVLAPLSPCPRSSVSLSSLLCQPVLTLISSCPLQLLWCSTWTELCTLTHCPWPTSPCTAIPPTPCES